jgi:ABC-type phosphate/phosphonate transport system ATPase subunit
MKKKPFYFVVGESEIGKETIMEIVKKTLYDQKSNQIKNSDNSTKPKSSDNEDDKASS